jgi:hypothetical protein
MSKQNALVRSLVLVTAVTSCLAWARQSEAASLLGGLDLNAYCRASGYAGASLDGSTGYDWHCYTSSGAKVGLSVTSACRWQYGVSTAVDRLSNYYNAYSWQCWNSAGTYGGLDLNAYCRASGYAGVSLDGSTAYDWHCYSSSGTKSGISMTSACRWRYGNSTALDRFANFFDPYSWVCWR